jgi:predicted ATPase
MLIEFRVKNFRSIREEQCLTMEAQPKLDEQDFRLRRVEGHKGALLCAAGIYGANASGKSNLLRAMAWMGSATRDSHRLWDPDGGIPREAFKWDGGPREDSLMEVKFVEDGVTYQYGFAFDGQQILEEWLHQWTQGRRRVLFKREQDRYHLPSKWLENKSFFTSIARKNSLFLSVLHQNNHQKFQKIIKKIIKLLRSNSPRIENTFTDQIFPNGTSSEIFNSYTTSKRKDVLDLLQASDLGIKDFKKTINKYNDSLHLETTFFRHNSINSDEGAWLDLNEESAGTQALVGMIPLIFSALDEGSVYVVDELESSLHPLLASKVIQLFQDPASNPRGAQLIFTTHDAALLGDHPAMEPLRRDQVWFTEKDAYGATRLYPLTDYKAPRKGVEDLEHSYLEGRYGGIPTLLPWHLKGDGAGRTQGGDDEPK